MRNLSVLPLVVGLMLVGCDDKPKKTSEQQQTSQITPLAVSCDDASVKNALVREVNTNIEKALNSLISEDDKKEVLMPIIQSRLSTLNVDLQQVTTQGETCQALVLLAVGEDELSSANRYFASKDVSFKQIMIDADARVEDGYLVSAVTYKPTEDIVQIDDVSLFELFAKIIRADALANITNTPKPIAIAKPSAEPRTMSERTTDKLSDKSTNETASKLTKSESTDVTASKITSTMSKTSASTIKINDTDNSDESPVKKSPTKSETLTKQITKTVKPATTSDESVVVGEETVKETKKELKIIELKKEPKAEAKPEPKSETKPEPVVEPKVVEAKKDEPKKSKSSKSSDEGMAVTETNDTY